MYKVLKNIIEMDDYSVQKLSKSQPPEPFEWNSVEGTELNVSDCIGGKGKIAVKGNTYQKSRVLPEGYTQVDYIESSRTQYIDTGFKPNQDTKIETKLNVVSRPTQYGDLFGSREETTNQFHIIIRDNGMDGRYGTENYVFYKSVLGLHSIVFDKNSLTIDDVTHTYSQQTFSSNYNAYIFGVNSKGSVQYPSVLKLYTFKIYDNNVLVRNFIPCYRNSDNEVGLYDIVNNVFYTNQGTGAFTYGSVVDIPNPEYPQEIKVVTGNNVIKQVGKNLANSYRNIWYSTISNTFTSNNNFRSCMAKVKPNTTYVISKKNISNRYVVITSSEKIEPDVPIRRIIVAKTNPNYTEYSFTTQADENYVFFGYYLGSNEEEIELAEEEIMIEEGSTPTTYEQYQEKNYNLNLSNIELCKIGDYQDILFKNIVGDENYNAELENGAWYKKNVLKKVIFNGTEEWSLDNQSKLFKTLLDLKFNSITSYVVVGVCSHFVPGSLSSSRNHSNQFSNYGHQILFNRNNMTLEEWVEWLNTHNLLVYYLPDSTTYTKITDTTLISQLEALNKAKWFKGTNHIRTETNNLEPVLKGTYRQAINE